MLRRHKNVKTKHAHYQGEDPALLQTFPPILDYRQTRLEFQGFGQFAYDLEEWSMTSKLSGAGTATDTGRLVWIGRKQADGSWKVWRKQPDGQWKVFIDAAWYSRSPN
jgi:ketosteroid isomerase-like protein